MEVATGETIILLAAAAKRAVRQRIRDRCAKRWGRKTTFASTKHLGLRHFLFKIKAAKTDRCSCDEGSQTLKHVLLHCPLYTGLRLRLWTQLDKFDVETDYANIMVHPQATRYVTNFMHRTGLLSQFQYVGIRSSCIGKNIHS